MKSLFDLKQDRILLLAKRHLAEQDYIYFDTEAHRAMAVMAKADNDLMVLTLEIQKAQTEQSMKASDEAWAKHRAGLAF